MKFDEDKLSLVMARELLRRNPKIDDAGYEYCPSKPTPKQQEFLELDNREALFGGAAGGGKSECLLMGALEDIHEPDYAALLLRRTYADLALPEAIMDRADSWLRGSPAKWSDKKKQWSFPSGAVLQFGYLATESDKYRYQSAAFQYIGFDELTQFTETQYRYMRSRVRRKAGSKLRLRLRSASNPGNIGHRWVGERFGIIAGDAGDDCAFVPSLLIDNPHIDQEEYRQTLEGLDATTRAQLLDGMWIADGNGLIYEYRDERNGIDISELPPVSRHTRYVLAIDLGAAAKAKTTAFVILRYDFDIPDLVTVTRAEVEAATTPSSIAKRIKELDNEYGGFAQMVCDDGALGVGYVREFNERWALPVKPATKRDKHAYMRLLNGDAQNGTLKIVRQACAPLLEQIQSLLWDADGMKPIKGSVEHATDGMLYGWREAKHWLAEAPPVIPKAGTRAYAEWEEQRMLEQDESQTGGEWFEGK